MSKAQIFTLDLLVAFVLFLFLFNLVNVVETRLNGAINTEEDRRGIANGCWQTVAELVSTPGDPRDWEIKDWTATAVSSVGLAQQQSVLDWQKFDKFYQLNWTNYTNIKALLGVGRFNYYLSLVWKNGTVYNTTGITAPSESSSAVCQRIVLLNDTEFILRLGVWRSEAV